MSIFSKVWSGPWNGCEYSIHRPWKVTLMGKMGREWRGRRQCGNQNSGWQCPWGCCRVALLKLTDYDHYQLSFEGDFCINLLKTKWTIFPGLLQSCHKQVYLYQFISSPNLAWNESKTLDSQPVGHDSIGGHTSIIYTTIDNSSKITLIK